MSGQSGYENRMVIFLYPLNLILIGAVNICSSGTHPIFQRVINMAQSEAIKEIYRKKGLKPPVGKGEHKVEFHKRAAAMIAAGVPKNIAYARVMKTLGRNKSVNKSHWSENQKD